MYTINQRNGHTNTQTLMVFASDFKSLFNKMIMRPDAKYPITKKMVAKDVTQFIIRIEVKENS